MSNLRVRFNKPGEYENYNYTYTDVLSWLRHSAGMPELEYVAIAQRIDEYALRNINDWCKNNCEYQYTSWLARIEHVNKVWYLSVAGVDSIVVGFENEIEYFTFKLMWECK